MGIDAMGETSHSDRPSDMHVLCHSLSLQLVGLLET